MSYDVAVIGAGPGGYVAAIRGAQLGLKIALIEKEELGGTCLNWGCIPSKALLKTSEHVHAIRHAKHLGIHVDGFSIDFPSVIKRSRNVVERLTKGIESILKSHKIDTIKGVAKFKNAKTLEVSGKELTAKHYIIATGAYPRMLPNVSVSKRIWTSKEALNPGWKELPKKILIIGAGAIGIEFASFYRQMGSDVTVVEMLDRILPQEDQEISQMALKIFRKSGMTIHVGQSIKVLKESKEQVEATFNDGRTEKFDVALVSIGVIPNTAELGLEKTRIQLNKGQIQVNSHNQTEESHIFAIGDVVAPPWLAHKASHEGIRVMEFTKDGKKHDLGFIPSCTYCYPQIASVGLTEEQTKAQGLSVKIGRFSFVANGKALAMNAEDGLIKTIFDAKTGALLGAHMIGAEVTEMIHSMALAITLEATEAEIHNTIFPHPTLSELIHESSLEAFDLALHMPKQKDVL